MHLLIIRHGECLAQSNPAYLSDPDSALSALGEKQAQQVAQRLMKKTVTHILSSPLIRSLATASIISKTIGVRPIQVWAELCEGWQERFRSLGRVELQQRFPQAVLPPGIGDEGLVLGGDASYEAFYARAEHTLHQIKGQFKPDDRLVIVTHGGFANNLVHVVLGISPATPRWFELENCSISHVRFVPEPTKERQNWPLYPPVEAEVLSINDVSHLSN